jgi:DNA-directed RNA polymerase subunit RPC12/RpoP
MQMGYRCRGCSIYENMEYHDWQCPHCGHDNLKLKVCVKLNLELILPEEEVRAINKLSNEQHDGAIEEIKVVIKDLISGEFSEDDIKNLEVSYEDYFE